MMIIDFDPTPLTSPVGVEFRGRYVILFRCAGVRVSHVIGSDGYLCKTCNKFDCAHAETVKVHQIVMGL